MLTERDDMVRLITPRMSIVTPPFFHFTIACVVVTHVFIFHLRANHVLLDRSA